MKKQKWYVQLPEGCYIVETRSIGHKWVYYKKDEYAKQFTKIKRSDWDRVCIRTLDQQQYRLDILNAFRKLGLDDHKPSRICRSHPTRRFGWEYKSFEEIEQEVLSYKQYSNLIQRSEVNA